MAELDSYNKDHKAHKAKKNVLLGPLQKMSIPVCSDELFFDLR